jgi:hypothetical protein
MLVVAGCPSAAVTQGMVPGMYIGMLDCSATALFGDGSTAAFPGASIGTSVEIVDGDTFYMDDVLYTPGAVHQFTQNGSPVIETVTGIDYNENNIVVRGTMDMFFGNVPASGHETVTIQKSSSTALDVDILATFTATDGIRNVMITETCGGTLTK